MNDRNKGNGIIVAIFLVLILMVVVGGGVTAYVIHHRRQAVIMEMNMLRAGERAVQAEQVAPQEAERAVQEAEQVKASEQESCPSGRPEKTGRHENFLKRCAS